MQAARAYLLRTVFSVCLTSIISLLFTLFVRHKPLADLESDQLSALRPQVVPAEIYRDHNQTGERWLSSFFELRPPLPLNNLGNDEEIAGMFGRSSPEASNLETGGKLSTWLKRATHDQSYFEIPDFPLEGQPVDRVTHIDADHRACLGAIRDQKRCGSCWAFSWTSLAEWHYCKQTGELIDLSEQHLVDCVGSRGCHSGSLTRARSFTDVNGFRLESDYPYKAKEGRCKVGPPFEARTSQFKRIKVDLAEWEQVLLEQPILVSTRLPEDIGSYQRGLHSGQNCDQSFKHGMLLVGMGRDQGRAYWLLRNSAGPKWGENGYLRLVRDAATMSSCFATGFVARFKFKEVDEELSSSWEPDYEPSLEPEPVVVTRRQQKAGALSSLLAS